MFRVPTKLSPLYPTSVHYLKLNSDYRITQVLQGSEPEKFEAKQCWFGLAFTMLELFGGTATVKGDVKNPLF